MFALWLLQLYNMYKIVQVIFLHGKLARAVHPPGSVSGSIHNIREEGALTAGHQLI